MKVAVLRFSALGDVAMTVPVVGSVARQHPHVRFVIVTQPWLCKLYEGVAINVTVHPCEPHGKHRGVLGMWRLAQELKSEGADAVADLHDVLRTKMLRTFLKLSGLRVKHIDKGRAEKRRLVREGWKACPPLRPQTERYADVFRALGMDCLVDFKPIVLPTLPGLPDKPLDERWIGVAPAAAHDSKVYPSQCLREALEMVAKQGKVRLFFFGREESVKADAAYLADRIPGPVHLASDFAHGLREELQLMQRFDAMVSMDSGNMHLASLVGIPVLSIWGATHPYMGFLGYGQKEEYCIQSERSCRPCTAYGAHPRCTAPYPCLEDLTPELVARRVCQAIHV